jgi:carbamoyl-phosphate synthase small subunit
LENYQIKDAVKAVAPTKVTTAATEYAQYTVAFWDFGGKNSSVGELLSYGLNVIRIPAEYTAEQILALNVDGVVLSDGRDAAVRREIIALLSAAFGVGTNKIYVVTCAGNS